MLTDLVVSGGAFLGDIAVSVPYLLSNSEPPRTISQVLGAVLLTGVLKLCYDAYRWVCATDFHDIINGEQRRRNFRAA